MIALRFLGTVAISVFLATGAIGQSAEQERLGQEFKKIANQLIDCVGHTQPHQCNNLARCTKIKGLMEKGDTLNLNELTTNRNDCACVRSIAGHSYVVQLLNAHGAQPHDERYKGCYGL